MSERKNYKGYEKKIKYLLENSLLRKKPINKVLFEKDKVKVVLQNITKDWKLNLYDYSFLIEIKHAKFQTIELRGNIEYKHDTYTSFGYSRIHNLSQLPAPKEIWEIHKEEIIKYIAKSIKRLIYKDLKLFTGQTQPKDVLEWNEKQLKKCFDNSDKNKLLFISVMETFGKNNKKEIEMTPNRDKDKNINTSIKVQMYRQFSNVLVAFENRKHRIFNSVYATALFGLFMVMYTPTENFPSHGTAWTIFTILICETGIRWMTYLKAVTKAKYQVLDKLEKELGNELNQQEWEDFKSLNVTGADYSNRIFRIIQAVIVFALVVAISITVVIS